MNRRSIHATIQIAMTPTEQEHGELDVSMNVGHGMLREAMRLLKSAGEAEGFEVNVEMMQAIY